MYKLLFLVVSVYGAAIPQNPSCLEKCLVAGGIVGAAADLNFFKSVAVDINNFCNVYTSLLKCASECGQDDLNLVMKHTAHASYVCKDKMEEFKTVHDCLESDTTDPLADCAKVCEVTEHVPLRLDSTATAPVNPNVPAEGTGPLCAKQMCVLKCGREQLNKQCAGAGDLFKEIARHQVEMGWDMLQAQSENLNDTASQLVALSYLANIPEKCVFLTNLESFDKEITNDMEKHKEMLPGSEFSNDTMTETVDTSVESSAVDRIDLFDPILFEFAPSLEPDVPIGPPNHDESSSSSSDSSILSTQPEAEVKILGDILTTDPTTISTTSPPISQTTTTPIPSTPLQATTAAAVDAPAEGVSKEEGSHEQPKPAEVPIELPNIHIASATATDEEATTVEVSTGDKEVAMEPRPTEAPIEGTTEESSMVEGPSGLIPSRTVTEEEKDVMEDEDDTTVTEAAPKATDEEKTEEKTETEEEKSKSTEMNKDDEGAKEEAEDTEGETEAISKEESDMTTHSVIVVEDEGDKTSEIDHNEVTPVTEKAKINGSPSMSIIASFIALVAVLIF